MFSRWTSLRSSLRWNSVTFCRYRSTLGKSCSERLAPTQVSSPTSASFITAQRLKSSTTGLDTPLPDDKEDEPIKFSTSKGHNMHPSFMHRPDVERYGYNPVPGEVFIVLFSLYAILIWFCILREPNDINEILEEGPMWNELSFLDGLGKEELQNCLQEYKKHGLNAEKIMMRIGQIEDEERLQNTVTRSTKS